MGGSMYRITRIVMKKRNVELYRIEVFFVLCSGSGL